MKKALKIGIMGIIGFMLFVYGGLNEGLHEIKRSFTDRK